MRLALFRNLSKSEQDKEVAKEKVEIQKAYQELCRLGTWNKMPKGFLKKGGDYVIWESKK